MLMNDKKGDFIMAVKDEDRKYKPYKRLNQEQKDLIYKLFEEKMELRKIARVIGVQLQTVQYHLKKTQRI